ncbi:STAS domain-containing protein [Nocardia sp. NPDC051030]|uniref:STAS domain-containing protein n=1 Tax=Nocardia sp. NPDC051030 TaxID=3155162 RepID=UPI00342EBB94
MPTISIGTSRLADQVPVAGHHPGRGAGRSHGVGSLDCLVVQVDGELDITGLDEFRHALSYAIAGSPSALVVDLRRTRFLSLRNAAALAEAMDAALARNIETHLLTGRHQIERALEVTGARARARRTASHARH